jgi:ubiquitin C-terminal hydrolase
LDIQDLTEFLKLNFISHLHHPLLYQIKNIYLKCRAEIKAHSKRRTITNSQLIGCLKNRKNIKIDIYRQGDSIEFFQNLIEEIQKELNGKTRNRNWKNVPEIGKLMFTQNIEMNKCIRCHLESCVDLSNFTLDLVNNNKLITNQTVSQALKMISSERQQDIPCTRCQNKKSKSIYTIDYPKYMLLKISRNRFNENTRRMERANHRIKPEKILSINSTSGSKTYSLFGGIVHRGGANSGHYIYITNHNNTWYSISDDKVFEMSESQAFEELETNATLLGYKEVIESNPWRIVQNKRPQECLKKLIESHNHIKDNGHSLAAI